MPEGLQIYFDIQVLIKKLESTSSHLIYNGEKTMLPTHIIHSCVGEGLAVIHGA